MIENRAAGGAGIARVVLNLHRQDMSGRHDGERRRGELLCGAVRCSKAAREVEDAIGDVDGQRWEVGWGIW